MIIGSTAPDINPTPASNGRIAFTSRRSGSEEIWIAGRDGSQPIRVSDRKLGIESLSWSPDGRRLILQASWNGIPALLAMDCDAQEPRCGTPNPIAADGIERELPSWSPDGRFIYFVAQAGKGRQVFRMPASGGGAVQVTRGEPVTAGRPSGDGKWLYIQRLSPSSIWRMPIDGDGNEELVVGPPDRPSLHWTVAGHEIVFWDTGGADRPSAIKAFDTRTKRMRTIIETATGYTPAVSSDGRTLYFGRADRSGGNIMVAKWSR